MIGLTATCIFRLMIILKQSDKEAILLHAKNCLPEEACGLLGGNTDANGNKTVKAVYPLTNADHSSAHFSMDPREQIAAIRDMRQRGIEPIGNYHSHPETPSRPSEEDKRLAFDSRASYMILSLTGSVPILKSFHIERMTVTEEELIITEDETSCQKK